MSEKTGMSRRDILGSSLAGAVVLTANSQAEAKAINDDPAALAARRNSAQKLRDKESADSNASPFPSHQTNGDEEDAFGSASPTYIANYSKGLAHNNSGEVDAAAYDSLIHALATGDPADFLKIKLGGSAGLFLSAEQRLQTFVAPLRDTTGGGFYRAHSERANFSASDPHMRFVNPQAGLAFDLEGFDSHALVMAPPPGFRSAEIIGEIAENYWMALARDIPFVEYDSSSTIDEAITNLNKFDSYKSNVLFQKHPATKNISHANLFRGGLLGDGVGPYVSQFLLVDIPFGAYRLPQKVAFSFMPDPIHGQRDFLLRRAEWLQVQRGIDPGLNPEYNEHPTYIHRGRDLASFVHIDELFQAYLNAALILGAPPIRGGYGALHNSGNPYDGYVPNSKPPMMRVSNQFGFGTLGEPNIKAMLCEVATRALKAVWYQKWVIHRRCRPEVFAGRIYFDRTTDASVKRSYPFDQAELGKLEPTLDAIKRHNERRGGEMCFLPMAFPEGSPLHPSYGAGHATVAGACVTLLKALYEGSLTYADLGAPIYVPSADGSRLISLKGEKFSGPYDYDELAQQMTIEGELNKLASNISLGRNFGGVHWRSDHEGSVRLGEAVAIEFLKETAPTYNEPVSFLFTTFDGQKISITK